MNEKLEKLNQEIEKTEKKLRRAQHEEKMLEHQIKTLTRKERTHRLCTRAAMLESYLPHPEAITDEQVSSPCWKATFPTRKPSRMNRSAYF